MDWRLSCEHKLAVWAKFSSDSAARRLRRLGFLYFKPSSLLALIFPRKCPT